MHKLRDFLITSVYLIKRIAKRFSDDNLTTFAAQAAFFMFISIFPFLMLFLNLLKYIPFFSERGFEAFLPDFISPQISSLLEDIIQEAGSKSSGALISITTITALWSSSKSFRSIMYGLNSVYKTTEKRGFIRVRAVAILYTVLFLFALVVVLVLMVFGNSILNTISEILPPMASITESLKKARWIVALGVLMLLFQLIYTVVPERKTKFKNEFFGALISAVGWIGFSALYSFYIDNFGNYSKLYGSFTAIILFLLWLYICMIILFVGAEINDMMRSHNVFSLFKRARTIKAKIK